MMRRWLLLSGCLVAGSTAHAQGGPPPLEPLPKSPIVIPDAPPGIDLPKPAVVEEPKTPAAPPKPIVIDEPPSSTPPETKPTPAPVVKPPNIDLDLPKPIELPTSPIAPVDEPPTIPAKPVVIPDAPSKPIELPPSKPIMIDPVPTKPIEPVTPKPVLVEPTPAPMKPIDIEPIPTKPVPVPMKPIDIDPIPMKPAPERPAIDLAPLPVKPKPSTDPAPTRPAPLTGRKPQPSPADLKHAAVELDGRERSAQLDEALAGMERQLKNSKAFSAKCSRTDTDSITRKDEVLLGSIAVLKPDMASVKLTHRADPSRWEQFVFNTNAVYEFQSKDKVVRQFAVQSSMQEQTIFGFLFGMTAQKLQSTYQVTFIQDDPTGHYSQLQILPKTESQKQDFSRIVLTLWKKPLRDAKADYSYFPRQVALVQPNGGVVKWDFWEIDPKAKLEPTEFVPKVPDSSWKVIKSATPPK